MLIEFSATNFRSIRELSTLSFVKAKMPELAATNTFSTNASATPELLNSSVIYGANAAGKSNMIKALQLVQYLVIKSSSESQAGKMLDITPFLLDEESSSKASEFEVTFVNEGVRYQYGFALTSERITEEWLFAYPKGRPQRLVERVYNKNLQTYDWGLMTKLMGKKQVWKDATRENALFLSTAIQLNNQQLLPVFNWFSEKLQIAGFGHWNPSFSIKHCEIVGEKEKIIDFLRAADSAIDDIELEETVFDLEHLSELPDEIKRDLEKELKGKTIIKVKTAHTLKNGKKVYFDLNDESDGTQKIFALAGPWLDALEKGITLVIDELHDNLHPLMVRFLVQLFHNKKTNPHNAQLIFTTHDSSILNQEVFRRDQIWFCEKDKNQASTFYPLTDFSPRKEIDLERGYLSGRYGALPYLRKINMAEECG